jgi:type IV secretion system protein VirD4
VTDITPIIKKHLLANIPYIFIFWFANKLGEAYRITPGDGLLEKLSPLMESVNKVFAKPMLSFDGQDLLVGLAGTALVFMVIYIRSKSAKKFRKNVEYGSARWGTKQDIKPYIDPKPENNVILTQTESLTMNPRPKNPAYARNKNVLIIGGSGSGKTRFWLKPNLMQMHSSYVVTDPKGSILVECGKLLERNGYVIKVLNTIDFAKSMKYNPFDYIRNEKDILKFVTALIANTKGEGKSGDDFWQKAETLLYTALMGFIHYEAPDEERNINTLVEMINAMEVREDDETFENAVDLMFKALKEREADHFAVRQYAKYKLAAGVIS